MTVKEVIAYLESFPEDYNVGIYFPEYDQYALVSKVKVVTTTEDRRIRGIEHTTVILS